MEKSNNNELQMTYLGLTELDKGFEFSFDGKNFPTQDFENNIGAVVNYVSNISLNPMIAKIEILDKKEYYVLSLNMPVMPSYFDITNQKELDLFSSPDYINIMKERARNLTNGEKKALSEERIKQYMNYIQHEFAGAYIKCKLDGKEKLAGSIQRLPFMRDFDLSNFKFSNSGRNIYKTPQFLKFRVEVEGNTQTRDYYMGLQENVNEATKDADFWKTVSQRDREYIFLDESMNKTIEIIKQKYGEIEFLAPTTSSNYSDSVSIKE